MSMLSYFKTTFVREEKNKMRHCIRCIILIFAFTELSAFENIHGSWHLLIADRKAEICKFVSASPQGQGRSSRQHGKLSCPLWDKKSSLKVFIFENWLFLLYFCSFFLKCRELEFIVLSCWYLLRLCVCNNL